MARQFTYPNAQRLMYDANHIAYTANRQYFPSFLYRIVYAHNQTSVYRVYLHFSVCLRFIPANW